MKTDGVNCRQQGKALSELFKSMSVLGKWPENRLLGQVGRLSDEVPGTALSNGGIFESKATSSSLSRRRRLAYCTLARLVSAGSCGNERNNNRLLSNVSHGYLRLIEISIPSPEGRTMSDMSRRDFIQTSAAGLLTRPLWRSSWRQAPS